MWFIIFSIIFWIIAILWVKKKIRLIPLIPSAREMFELSKEIKAMPVGVVLISTKKFDLETLPDGFVTVRRMTYGEELDRQGMATKFKMGGTGTTNAANKDAFQGELDINTKDIALWDFANLVVEHNITDKDGRLLNFKNSNDVSQLHPAIGKEIGEHIDSWQASILETEDEVKNS